MAATMDSAFCGNYEIGSFEARAGQFTFGRLTGTYGGAWTSITIGGMNQVAFVIIPPVSNYLFQYSASTTQYCILYQGASASNSVLASVASSIDLSSFTCMLNGVATAGVAFAAFGWGS